ncbi:MAG: DUF2461 family protein [Planctomycetota bacterium]
MTIETDDWQGIPAAAFTLLGKLERNNDAAWARDHSNALATDLRAPFIAFLEAASRRLTAAGSDLEGGAQTTFRMRRDLRFTTDRRPLHEHVEGMLSRGRRRIGCRGAIHVRLDRSGGFLRAGSFLQPAEGRRALREAMLSRRRSFLSIVRALEAAEIRVESRTELQRVPRGFEVAGGERLAPYLRMNEPVAEVTLTRAEWRDGSAIERVVEFAARTRRWLMFQREALADVPDLVLRPPRSPPRP